MKKLKRHIFTHAKNIVIGGDIASFLFAFKHDYHVVFTNPTRPFFFEKFPTGAEKEKIWMFLYYQMVFRGRVLGVMPNGRIRTEGDILKIITAGNSLLNYEFEQVYCFEPEMLANAQIKEKINRTHLVVDKLKMSAREHSNSYHFVGDDFVNEIYFDNFGRAKTVYAVSRLKENGLNDFDFGAVSLRYKLMPIIKNLGILGSRNGKNKKLSVKLDVVNRETVPKEKHLYHEEEKIKFMYITEEDLWNSQASCAIVKWSESSRWMDSKIAGNCRMLLT